MCGRYDQLVEVVVYTRRDCPLCESAIGAARSVFGDDRVVLVDVDLDLALLEKYTDRVPVIESETAEIIAEGIVSERTLREYVRASR